MPWFGGTLEYIGVSSRQSANGGAPRYKVRCLRIDKTDQKILFNAALSPLNSTAAWPVTALFDGACRCSVLLAM